MEFAIGIKCNDFVLLACDKKKCRGIMCQKDDVEKMYKIGTRQLLAITGENSDDVHFADYIIRNVAYQTISNEFETSTHAVANYSRKALADAIRSRGMYQANMFIAGCDNGIGPKLYYLDYLGALVEVPFGIHGYGGFFGMSILDRFYRPDLHLNEAVELLWMVIRDIEKRFIVNLPKFTVKAINSNGISVVNEELTVR